MHGKRCWTRWKARRRVVAVGVLSVAAAVAVSPPFITAVRGDVVSAVWNWDGLVYDYRITHMADFDQRRLETADVNGLPNDGAMYCVPTATMNLFAYAANHGYPSTLPGPGYYQLQSTYNEMTTFIGLLGYLMSTTPGGGTNGSGWTTGAADWIGPPLVTKWQGATSSYAPTLDEIAKVAINGAIVSFAFGRYDISDSRDGVIYAARNGGHAVTLVRATRSGYSLSLGYRDAADDAADTSQSSFKTATASVTQVLISPPDGEDLRVMHALNYTAGDARIRLIDSYLTLQPMYGLTFLPGQDNLPVIKVLTPFTLHGRNPTPERIFRLPAGSIVRDAVLMPSDDAVAAVVQPPGQSPQVQTIDMMTGLAEARLTLADPSHLVFLRNRLLYVTDRLAIKSFDPDDEWASVNESSPDGPFDALAYDDRQDHIVALNIAHRRIYRYRSPLGANAGAVDIPREVPAAGDGAVSVNPVDGNLYFVTSALNQVVTINADGSAGLIDLPCAAAPTGLDFSDEGDLFVMCDGGVRQLRRTAETRWQPVPTAFVRFEVGPKLLLTRSRTNFVAGLHDTPAFNNIPPEELDSDPATLDCDSDLNDDRVTNVHDLLIVLGGLGQCGVGPCRSDVNGDRVTNLADVRQTWTAFGPCR